MGVFELVGGFVLRSELKKASRLIGLRPDGAHVSSADDGGGAGARGIPGAEGRALTRRPPSTSGRPITTRTWTSSTRPGRSADWPPPTACCWARARRSSSMSSGCALVEERRGPGTYVGPLPGDLGPGGPVRGPPDPLPRGATKGHYVQGTPTPTAIDTGTAVITSSRVIFQGSKQTRECPFAKLIGYRHDADGSTTFSLANRAKPVTVHYGTAVAPTFDFRLELALAHFREHGRRAGGRDSRPTWRPSTRPGPSVGPGRHAIARRPVGPEGDAPSPSGNPTVRTRFPTEHPHSSRDTGTSSTASTSGASTTSASSSAARPWPPGWYPDPWGAAPAAVVGRPGLVLADRRHPGRHRPPEPPTGQSERRYGSVLADDRTVVTVGKGSATWATRHWSRSCRR